MVSGSWNSPCHKISLFPHLLSLALGDCSITHLLVLTYALTSVVYNAEFLAVIVLGASVIGITF